MNNQTNWQQDILPSNMIKFRLDKKQGTIAVNGIEILKCPTAKELVEFTQPKSIWRAYGN